jgi:hypothetical protein
MSPALPGRRSGDRGCWCARHTSGAATAGPSPHTRCGRAALVKSPASVRATCARSCSDGGLARIAAIPHQRSSTASARARSRSTPARLSAWAYSASNCPLHELRCPARSSVQAAEWSGGGVDPALDGAHIGNVAAPASVGCSAVKSCPIRSGASTGRWPAMVVFFQARGWRPRRPAARISRQTLLGPIRTPRTTSLAQTRRTPECPSSSVWISRMCSESLASVRSRSHGPAEHHR